MVDPLCAFMPSDVHDEPDMSNALIYPVKMPGCICLLTIQLLIVDVATEAFESNSAGELRETKHHTDFCVVRM